MKDLSLWVVYSGLPKQLKVVEVYEDYVVFEDGMGYKKDHTYMTREQCERGEGITPRDRRNAKYDLCTFDKMVEKARHGDVYKIKEPDDGTYMVFIGDVYNTPVPIFLPSEDTRNPEVGSRESWITRGAIFEYQENLTLLFSVDWKD